MEKIIVLDTETANSLEEPMAYDLGFIVTDVTGRIYESHSFVIKEIFDDTALMSSAYYAEKRAMYIEDIRAGRREVVPFIKARKIFREACKKYDITRVYAHNAHFDRRSCTGTHRYVYCSKYTRYFFPYGIQICDTLAMARNILTNDPEYIEFCQSNGFMTKHKTPRCRMTAEVIYRFLTNDLDFVESHTGLEDVMIEKEIYRYCVMRDPNFLGEI